jgi:hypothetical protein
MALANEDNWPTPPGELVSMVSRSELAEEFATTTARHRVSEMLLNECCSIRWQQLVTSISSANSAN